MKSSAHPDAVGTIPLFRQMLPEVMATFTLPPLDVEHRNVKTMAFPRTLYLPYPCVRVVQPWDSLVDDMTGEHFDVRGRTETVFIETERGITGCGLDAYTSPTLTVYEPETSGDECSQAELFWGRLVRLLDFLEDDSIRYVETKVTRQVRRYEGLDVNHRYFIIVRRGERKRYRADELLTKAAMGRRLHAVRSHLRHLPTGLVTVVRAHPRGKVGSAIQVSDYRIGEQS